MKYVMGNIVENNGNGDGAILIGKTIRDTDNNLTALIIPKKFTKKLNIENSNVSISLVNNYEGNIHLLISNTIEKL